MGKWRSRAAGVTGVVLTSALLTSGVLAAPQALAATGRTTLTSSYPSQVYMNGTRTSTPFHVVAVDPWSGNATSWVPIFYLQQALQHAGIVTSWNGQELLLTPPAGTTLPTATVVPPHLSNGEMDFNAGQRVIVVAPKMVRVDPTSGQPTTLVPVYYANRFLAQALGAEASWYGSNWMIDTKNMLVASTVVQQAMDSVSEVSLPSEHFGYPAQQVISSDGAVGTLSAVVGMRDPTADGYGQLVFFFHDGQFVGINAMDEATEIRSVLPHGPDGFVVTFSNYKSTDALVDPTLPPQVVLYTWDGTGMMASAALASGVTGNPPTAVTGSAAATVASAAN